MSIETTLTLLVAGGILLVAAVLKATFHGLMWIAVKLSGCEVPRWGSRGGAVAALPRVPLTTRLGHGARRTGGFLQGAATLSIFVIATIANWIGTALAAVTIVLVAIYRWIESATIDAYQWSKPHVVGARAATARNTRSAYTWTRPRVAGASAAIVHALVTGLDRLGRWYVDTVIPFLLETGEATRDVVTPEPERLGDIALFVRTSPVLAGGSPRSSRAA
jgi:hypothetical protein